MQMNCAIGEGSQVSQTWEFAGVRWDVTRPKSYVLVIHGGTRLDGGGEAVAGDYLHDYLLRLEMRAAFFDVVDATGLVICKNLSTRHPSYRDVRGRSSHGRLSQGEYYHHDGCTGPTKPRFVEIRCPHQDFPRLVATAVAPFAAVIPAMVASLPSHLAPKITALADAQALAAGESLTRVQLDQLQGLITRLVRKEMPAEEARAYFREVDRRCDAYFVAWERGESRMIANDNGGATMQHRRAHQIEKWGGSPSGRLVKRWPAEELIEPGATVAAGIAELIACESDGACMR